MANLTEGCGRQDAEDRGSNSNALSLFPASRILNPFIEMHYAELHCKTNFSFLEGASHADELVRQAKLLEYQRWR